MREKLTNSTSLRKHSLVVRLGILSLAMIAGVYPSLPCTVAVVSGRATPDGRPLLWKNRDTSSPDNKIVFIQGEKHSFLAVVDARDTAARSIWQGLNDHGFAIMNSLSRDLAPSAQAYIENGTFMRRALSECANVAEFEALLKETDGRRRVAANYGVIDAEGQASLFETAGDRYVRFDAADPRVAPQGFITRTNYAFTAPEDTDTGGGYIRFERVQNLFERAAAEGRLDLRFILQEAARDLVNEKLHSDPMSALRRLDPSTPLYVRTNDTLNRRSTVSVSVFHGAATPENAHLATMWTILGQPICSVAVPLWVAGEQVPKVLGGSERAPMCELAKTLMSYLYPDERANMRQYLNVTRFMTYAREGFMPRLLRIENEIMASTRKRLAAWTQARPDPEEIREYTKKTAAWAYSSLLEAFPDILQR